MKKYPFIRACWLVADLLLAFSVIAVVYSIGWELSTRSYLKGFSDAIVPASDDPVQKIEAILKWMAHGPARRSAADPGGLADRNPEDTLNTRQLLEVCGTATNAFVNLAESSGLRARRLLLLDGRGQSKHVVVEILIGDRWVVADPSWHVLLRLPDGHMPTYTELKNPAIFRAATQSIPNYPPSYTYERTVYVRLRRIPLIGDLLRRIFDVVWPPWEQAFNWTLLVERESFAMLTMTILLLCFTLTVMLLLGWYCSSRLGLARVRFRDQIVRAGHALVENSH
jgi:hypothetical protein